jgi:hypothetical protein
LDTLLHLNDAVSFTLNSAMEFLTAHGITHYNLLSAAAVAVPEAPVDGSRQERRESLTPQELPSVVSILYMLRRGSHEEMALAVAHLLTMTMGGHEVGGGAGGQRQQDAINDMRSAGGLQTLVSAIGRCSDWPDVELQISTAIAVMVSNESDWHLLVKGLMLLFNSAYGVLLTRVCCVVSQMCMRFCPPYTCCCSRDRPRPLLARSRMCTFLRAPTPLPTTSS